MALETSDCLKKALMQPQVCWLYPGLASIFTVELPQTAQNLFQIFQVGFNLVQIS
jgi:hypothetical protein